MIRTRMTKKRELNPDLVDATAGPQRMRSRGPAGLESAATVEDNAALIERMMNERGMAPPVVVLFGGTDLLHVRVRNAQSRARTDLKPSWWSCAAILGKGETGLRVTAAGTHGHASLAGIPERNAVIDVPLSDYADPVAFPNVAVLDFPVTDRNQIGEGIEYLERARLALDLVGPLAQWLTYLWGVGQTGNPLLAGIPEPSALFVDRVFAFAGVDITPGLAEPVVCPEAIWQAALLWRDFYEEKDGDAAPGAGPTTPRGFHVVRQKAAAVFDPTDTP